MKAIIFNSGIGKRMGEFTQHHPKAMVMLPGDETIFERQIRILGNSGIKDFIVTTGPFPEQFIEASQKFPQYHFTFVHNDQYDKTNYIYSMFLASNNLNDDVLLLHGDLVFDEKLVSKMLVDSRPSLALINEKASLPEKDFKGRVRNGYLKEVSIHIFENDCYAFQPLYKLQKKDVSRWVLEVQKFVNDGKTNVYAEEALNQILEELQIPVMSYDDYYIEEIDNQEDYQRVSDKVKTLAERRF